MRIYLDPTKVLDIHGAIVPRLREFSLGGRIVRSVRDNPETVYVEVESKFATFFEELGLRGPDPTKTLPGPESVGMIEEGFPEVSEEFPITDFLDEVPINTLDLTPVMVRTLERLAINTIGQLKAHDKESLMTLPGIGETSATKILGALDTFLAESG